MNRMHCLACPSASQSSINATSPPKYIHTQGQYCSSRLCLVLLQSPFCSHICLRIHVLPCVEIDFRNYSNTKQSPLAVNMAQTGTVNMSQTGTVFKSFASLQLSGYSTVTSRPWRSSVTEQRLGIATTLWTIAVSNPTWVSTAIAGNDIHTQQGNYSFLCEAHSFDTMTS